MTGAKPQRQTERQTETRKGRQRQGNKDKMRGRAHEKPIKHCTTQHKNTTHVSVQLQEAPRKAKTATETALVTAYKKSGVVTVDNQCRLETVAKITSTWLQFTKPITSRGNYPQINTVDVS